MKASIVNHHFVTCKILEPDTTSCIQSLFYVKELECYMALLCDESYVALTQKIGNKVLNAKLV